MSPRLAMNVAAISDDFNDASNIILDRTAGGKGLLPGNGEIKHIV